MTEDTIRTRVLTNARDHWRTVLHVASWGLAALVTVSVGVGRKQGDISHYQEAITRIETKLDGVVIDVGTIKQEQASARMAQKDLGERIGRMEDNWDTAFQHAGDWPRPRKHK
jgi:hypothetical protein